MKKTFLILLTFLLGFISVNAQVNPFAELGYTPKIATLSKGQFIESFDNDTIVNIGTVLFNTKSKQIVAFVKKDTLYSEATLEPDIVSRWISPDPLADHPTQVSFTPYHYAGNNPVYWTDPDGRCPWCLVWLAVEVGSAIYDAYDAYQTIKDDNLTTGQKVFSVGTTVVGSALLPGPAAGYKTAGKVVVREGAEYLAKTKTDDLVKRADDMVTSFTENFAKKSTKKSLAHEIAAVGENHLKSLGGVSQYSQWKMPKGMGARVTDQLVNGVAYEAKTGYKTLTTEIYEQIAKDAYLLKTKQVDKVMWNFYRSPHTNKAGASKALQKELKKAGIDFQMIDL